MLTLITAIAISWTATAQQCSIDGNGKPYPVHITLDDGPSAKNTGKILDILKNFNQQHPGNRIHATFFLSTSNFPSLAAGSPPTPKEQELLNLVERMRAEGHTVGCHSYDHIEHANPNKVSDQAARANMNSGFRVMKGINDYLQTRNLSLEKPVPFRFPFGSGWFVYGQNKTGDQAEQFFERRKSMMGMVTNPAGQSGLTYTPVHWDADSFDYSETKRIAAPQSILSQLCSHKGGIVLMHDTLDYEASHFQQNINAIDQAGYRFGSVADMRADNTRRDANSKFQSLSEVGYGLWMSCSEPAGAFDQIVKSCAAGGSSQQRSSGATR